MSNELFVRIDTAIYTYVQYTYIFLNVFIKINKICYFIVSRYIMKIEFIIF